MKEVGGGWNLSLKTIYCRYTDWILKTFLSKRIDDSWIILSSWNWNPKKLRGGERKKKKRKLLLWINNLMIINSGLIYTENKVVHQLILYINFPLSCKTLSLGPGLKNFFFYHHN